MLPPHEIYRSRGSVLSMMYSAGKTKTRELSESEGYGVRVLRDGRIGFAYCVKEKEIEKAVTEAGIASRFSKQSGFSFAGNREYPAVKVYDEKIAGTDAAGLRGILDQIKDGASKYSDKIKIILTASNGETGIENTAGLSGEYPSTSISVYVEVMDGTGFGFYSNAFTYLPKNFISMGREAAEMARKTRMPVKPEAGEYNVIMEPEATDDLMDVLLPSFIGEWKRRKISGLSEKAGQKVFSSKFSLYDDSTLNGTGGRPFDDEGTPSVRKALVEKGIVKDFVYDRENAALEGVGEEGNCSRPDFSSMPGTGYSNTVVGTGDYANLEETGKALIVKSLHGTHTANRISGDFGVEVNSAFLWNGKERIPVRGFMLTGNIFNIFKNIIGIEKRAKEMGSFYCPRIAFEKIRVVS